MGDKICGDCGVQPGRLHLNGCDVERCADCGGQRISCDCEYPAKPRLKWTGTWPGDAECIEFGWYSKRNHKGVGYVRCSKDDPEAGPDLNRLYDDARWDKKLGRFVLKEA